MIGEMFRGLSQSVSMLSVSARAFGFGTWPALKRAGMTDTEVIYFSKARLHKKRLSVRSLTTTVVRLTPPLIVCTKHPHNRSSCGNGESTRLKHGGFLQRLFSTDVSCKTVEDVAEFMRNGVSQKIIVMAGAGLSSPSGIPDFRTPGTGLYYNLQKYDLPYPEAIFDIEYFSVDPKPFYMLAEELYPSGKYRPNACHYFVRLLNEKGLLLKAYTQNIDGLERLAGVPEEKLVEAHGSFSSATCRVCLKSYSGDDIKEAVFKGEVPKCKRSWCNGVIKPDIVFFGEQLPTKFWCFLADMPRADLLIIMGTSLEVQPFAGIAEAVLPGVPRILFNMEATGPFAESPRRNDVVCEGDLVSGVLNFCELLGWREDLEKLVDKCEGHVESIKSSEE